MLALEAAGLTSLITHSGGISNLCFDIFRLQLFEMNPQLGLSVFVEMPTPNLVFNQKLSKMMNLLKISPRLFEVFISKIQKNVIHRPFKAKAKSMAFKKRATRQRKEKMSDKPEVSSSSDSSLIREASYDPFMKVLTVDFRNGGKYEYIEVPEEVYTQLCEAPSAGKFFHINIKNKFEFLRRK